ncbi:MAG: hypothetical protein WC510_07735 [Candidatus Omnitrophota bacterium]
MLDKTKIIIIGLVAILAVSLFVNLQVNIAKKSVERERNELKSENTTLTKKVEESLKNNQQLIEKVTALKNDVDKLGKEKEDIKKRESNLQKQYELILKERDALKSKASAPVSQAYQKESSPTAPSSPSPSGDSYWSGVLKAKTSLEYQIDTLRNDLKTIQINNEQIQKEKDALDLDVKNLMREKRDLEQQLEYTQKMFESVNSELVIEKNSRFKMQDNLKPLRSENAILRRQLKSLSSYKANLERKLKQAREDKAELERRFAEMGTMLESRLSQIGEMRQEINTIGTSGTDKQEAKRESIELPPIVVYPPSDNALTQGGPLESSYIGKVLEVNRENNYVVLDLGLSSGVRLGQSYRVYRGKEEIGAVKVIQVSNSVSACDIKRETQSIEVGDRIK